jgi:hypothetical protein
MPSSAEAKVEAMQSFGCEKDVAAVIPVLVPYDRDANYPYADAIGESRQEALAHFTTFGRFDLSLSEIFHMEFIEAALHHGGATGFRSDVMPCILPVSKSEGLPYPMGVAQTEDECRRILSILRQDCDGYSFIPAGLKLSERTIL